jgi:hypothetical protein
VSGARWSAARAADWYARQPWLVGCNFIPSNASNQLEMWQAETFDPATLDRELGWAAALGMNTVRVFLHDLLWQADAAGFRQRIDAFLGLAQAHGIATLLVLFDDCWHGPAGLGPQPAPVPGRHNSRWLQSPGRDVVANRAAWGPLEAYVQGVVGAFGSDARVLGFDLYNEPSNHFAGVAWRTRADAVVGLARAAVRRALRLRRHVELVRHTFAWARAAQPEVPLTVGVWFPGRRLAAALIEASDVVSFHEYASVAALERRIAALRRHGRPILCTEFMARSRRSRLATHLPVFQREKVGCFTWGLVRGRTQTHLPWTWSDPAREPEPWFHDLLHPDGTPYDPEEAALLRRLCGYRVRDGG